MFQRPSGCKQVNFSSCYPSDFCFAKKRCAKTKNWVCQLQGMCGRYFPVNFAKFYITALK